MMKSNFKIEVDIVFLENMLSLLRSINNDNIYLKDIDLGSKAMHSAFIDIIIEQLHKIINEAKLQKRET